MEIDKHQAIEFLAKGLVELHAPQELDYFEALKQQPSDKLLDDDDDAFAFGAAEIVPAITPIAMMIASVAFDFVVTTMAEAGADVLKEKYKNWARSLFSEKPQTADFLTPEQRTALVKALLAAALKSGIKADLAVKLSSSFVDKVL
ncbi:hypothetical protein [Pseudomonas fluorescens]|uniref:hypothetical protein n=1 Tax=Pseudomonas fluorescens TaxID=294 RepID=UPI00178531E9|nr:hypothetical protein [Pseudomonas fluorescens]